MQRGHDERDKKILRYMKRKRGKSVFVREIAKAIGERRETVSRHLSALEGQDVTREFVRGKPAWVLLSSSKSGKREVDFRVRKEHSDNLKEEAIKPWMEGFPCISDLGDSIYLPLRTALGGWTSYRGQDLDFEKHELFKDLDNHLPKLILENWKMLKEAAKRFYEKRDSILLDLSAQIENKFGLKISANWKCNSISGLFPEFILRAGFAWALGDEESFGVPARKWFEKEYVKFASRVDVRDDGLHYYVGTYGYVWVERNNHDPAQFQQKTDQQVRELIEDIQDARYCEEIRELLKEGKCFRKLREFCLQALNKELRKPVLSGDCDYISC